MSRPDGTLPPRRREVLYLRVFITVRAGRLRAVP